MPRKNALIYSRILPITGLLSITLITSCDMDKAGDNDVNWQYNGIGTWTDALKKSEKPFRLVKVNGIGCFLATWGGERVHGGPAMSPAPDQKVCDDPRYAPYTVTLDFAPGVIAPTERTTACPPALK